MLTEVKRYSFNNKLNFIDISMACKLIKGSLKDYRLQIDITTSTLEDHNSFDYETMVEQVTSMISSRHNFQLTHQYIHILRNDKTHQVTLKQMEGLRIQKLAPKTSLLGVFEIRYVNKNVVLRLYQPEDLVNDKIHGMTNQENINNKELHQIYAIVRSFKNQQQESIGYRLKQGSFLKIGQKQFVISSVRSPRSVEQESVQQKLMLIDSIINRHKRMKIEDIKQQGECKYCMMEEGQGDQQFLCSPCKCSGSCAMVHFSCLQKWNQSKVKKNQVKGLTYYNFQKFFCEVCKEEYPKFIEKGQKIHQLMPIEMPKGEHIILQEIDLKCSSLICIENIPQEGIRMGRGNECEIKVDSPSISRNHARIMKKYGDYYIFDNKSKFGTLIRQPKIYLEIDFTRKGIQIDRSVLMFSLSKKKLLS